MSKLLPCDFCQERYAKHWLSYITIAVICLGALGVDNGAVAEVVLFEFDPIRLVSVADVAPNNPAGNWHNHNWHNLGPHAVGGDANIINIEAYYNPTHMNADSTAGAGAIRANVAAGVVRVPIGSPTGHVSPFSLGQEIGPDTETRAGVPAHLSIPSFDGSFSLNGGQFGSGYLGFSVNRPGGTHYGWLDIVTNAPGESFAQATITRWAFETTPNTPILAGVTGGGVDPAAGDFDGDGDVDGRDFLIWQRGETSPPLDAGDLADWQNHYGTDGPLLANVNAIPEPSSLALLMAGVVGAMAFNRRRNLN